MIFLVGGLLQTIATSMTVSHDPRSAMMIVLVIAKMHTNQFQDDDGWAPDCWCGGRVSFNDRSR